MCVIGFKLITHILNYMNSNIIAKSIKVEKVKNIVDIVLELLKKVSYNTMVSGHIVNNNFESAPGV